MKNENNMTTFALNLGRKRLLKTGLFVLAGLGAQTALACPSVYNTNEVVRLNTATDEDGKTIYFCKNEGVANPQLSLKSNDLINGGNQVIAINQNPIQKKAISGSVNLIGPGAMPLNLKPVTASINLPADIFNFYTRVDVGNSIFADFCSGTPRREDQYEIIRAYLRNNPGTFQANNKYPSSSGPKQATALNTGNDLAIIKNAEIKNGNSTLKADITFCHTNANKNKQYYTDRDKGKQFCWVAVGARVDIKEDSNNINRAGEHLLDISVKTP